MLTPQNANYVSDVTISSVAFDEFLKSPMMMPFLFTQRPSRAAQEKSASISALGNFQPKQPTVEAASSEPVQQFTKTYVHQPYSLQSAIAREIIDTQRFDFFGQFGTKLGESAGRTVEQLGADVFNYAFAATPYPCEDLLSLCNAAHVNKDGGNSQANRGTSALSHAAVTTTRAAGRALTDYTGNKINVNYTEILVPAGTALEETMFEIVRSSLRSDAAASNAANFNQGLKGYSWQWLTDANNWFMMDPGLRASNLIWYWLVALELFGDGDMFKGTRRVGGYFSSSHGPGDWRWIFGHEVT